MKITKTQRIEKEAVRLYRSSRQKEDTPERRKARKTIDRIVDCFRLLSVFTEEDHAGVVNKLYFCDKNILIVGVREMSRRIFIQERTLRDYRERYCEVIERILRESEEEDLLF